MSIRIRKETPEDFTAVDQLIRAAFAKEKYSDHQEHLLVEKLRKSEAFIPELSLVAEFASKIVGYILLTQIKIVGVETERSSLALAPVAVLPEYQGQKIGGQLIQSAHQIAKDLGYQSVVVLGHEKYYPRFGYKKAVDFGIQLPFDVPEENSMVLELIPDALKNVRGEVVYPKEFY